MGDARALAGAFAKQQEAFDKMESHVTRQIAQATASLINTTTFEAAIDSLHTRIDAMEEAKATSPAKSAGAEPAVPRAAFEAAIAGIHARLDQLQGMGPLSPADGQAFSRAVDGQPVAMTCTPTALPPPGSAASMGASSSSSLMVRSPSPTCAGTPPSVPRPSARASSSVGAGKSIAWELVKGDHEMKAMLKDVRKQIEGSADRAEREATKQRTILPADETEHGTLFVRLDCATDLAPMDTGGTSDPYFKLALGGMTQRSRTVKKNLNPRYEQVFQYRGVLGELLAKPLKVVCWDADQFSLDDHMGAAEVELGGQYMPQVERGFTAELDTQGSVALQVWWQSSDDSGQRGLLSRFFSRPAKGTGKGWCRWVCGPVLHPDSRFRSTWNIALALFITYCGIAVPLEIAFETDMVDAMCGTGEAKVLRGDCDDFQIWFWGNFCVDMWFICDIVINMRTGYMQEGHYISDDWLSAKKYLKGSFVMDCLGTFPLNILLMILNPDNPYGDILEEEAGGGADVGRVNRMLRLLRMAKLAKLMRMRKLAKSMEGFEEVMNPGVVTVMKLTLIALFCCHWIGCAWWLVSDIEISEGSSPWYAGENGWHPPRWLKHEADLSSKYVHSFFWGAGMVTSLVPRDIEPVTPLEGVVTTMTMFFGLLLNAIVISSLTSALASMDAKKELVGKQLAGIQSYLMLKSVPNALRSRIIEYYEYLFTSSAAFADMNMFERMPPALSAQLNLSTNRKLIGRCPSLFNEVSNATLITLTSQLLPLVFVPDQLVLIEGERLDAAYFIHQGRIKVSCQTKPPRVLMNLDNFGVEDFVAGRIRNEPAVNSAQARAVTYCDVVSISVETLTRVLDRDPTFLASIQERRRRRAASPDGDKSPSPTQKRNWKSWVPTRRRSPTAAEKKARNLGLAAMSREQKAMVNLASRVSSAGASAGGASSTASKEGGSFNTGSSFKAAVLRAADRASRPDPADGERPGSARGTRDSSPDHARAVSFGVAGSSPGGNRSFKRSNTCAHLSA